MAERSIIFDLIGRDLASKAFDSVGRSAEKLGRNVEGSNKSLGMALGGIGKIAGVASLAAGGLGGLAFAAVFLAAAVRLRRYREPI